MLVFIGEQWLELVSIMFAHVWTKFFHINQQLLSAPHSLIASVMIFGQKKSIAKTLTLISLASLLSPKAGYCSSYLILIITSMDG